MKISVNAQVMNSIKQVLRVAIFMAFSVYSQVSLASSQALVASEPQLRLVIKNVRSDEGDIAIAIFPKERAEDFPKNPKVAVASKLVPAKKGETVVVFSGLKPGVYAVSLLHDENKDGKMNFNFVGMPKEGFGFSRDPKIYFGAPDFSKCEIEISEAQSDIHLTTKYF